MQVSSRKYARKHWFVIHAHLDRGDPHRTTFGTKQKKNIEKGFVAAMDPANDVRITRQELSRYNSYSVFGASGEPWRCKCGRDCLRFLRDNQEARLVMLGVGCDAQQRQLLVAQDAVLRHVMGAQKGSDWFVSTGEAVCSLAYARMRAISAETLKIWKKDAVERFRLGVPLTIVPEPHGRVGAVLPSHSTLVAMQHTAAKIRTYGDLHPSLKVTVLNLWHDEKDLFVEYSADLKKCGVVSISYRTFASLFDPGSILRQQLGLLRFCVGCTQKVCTHCTALKKLRRKLYQCGKGIGSSEMETFQARWDAHTTIAKELRREYERISQDARESQMSKRVVMTMDESHAIKTPPKPVDTAASRKIFQMESLFAGVIDHNAGSVKIFTCGAEGVPHEKDRCGTWKLGDVSVSLIFEHIIDLRKQGRTGVDVDLYLQIDGGSTVRNLSLLLLLAVLQARGWFRRVYIALLLTGHTHIDIDQVFSWFWVAYDAEKHYIHTWTDMLALLQRVYSKRDAESRKLIPSLFHLRRVFKLQELLKDHRSQDLKGIFGSGKDDEGKLTKPHFFVIEEGVEMRPVISTFCSSVNNGTGPLYEKVEMFRSCPNLSQLGFYDLKQQWEEVDRKRILENWDSKTETDLLTVDMSRADVEEMRNSCPAFENGENPFLSDGGEEAAGWVALCQLNGSGSERDVDEEGDDSSVEDPDEQATGFVEAILDRRLDRFGRYEYLCRWEGGDPDEWVPEDNMDDGPVYQDFVQKLGENASTLRRIARISGYRGGAEIAATAEAAAKTRCPTCGNMFKRLAAHQKHCKGKDQ